MRDEWFGGFTEGLKGINETDWDTIKASEGSFKAAYYSTNIPLNVVDVIWEAIVSIDRPLSMVEELRLAAFIPTVEEWLAAVHSSKRNTSPGMNGVTYDLLRELPEIVLRGLY